jgi:hypothetical protein
VKPDKVYIRQKNNAIWIPVFSSHADLKSIIKWINMLELSMLAVTDYLAGYCEQYIRFFNTIHCHFPAIPQAGRGQLFK